MRTVNFKRRQAIQGLILISPWIIGTILFFLYPAYETIALSVSELDSIKGLQKHYLGFNYYKNILFESIAYMPMYTRVFKEMLIRTPLVVVFSLFIAILLNLDIKGRGVLRSLFVLPFLLGSGFIMQQIMNQGLQDEMGATAMGTDTTSVGRGTILIPREVLWYLGPQVSNLVTQFLSRITEVLWKCPVPIILFLGGLQSISGSLYESAKVDGATQWEMFWKITLPMIGEIILVAIIYTLIDMFSESTNQVMSVIHSTAFRSTRFEFAAALACVYIAIILILIAIIFGIAALIGRSKK